MCMQKKHNKMFCLLVSSVLFTACSDSGKSGPPKADVQSAVSLVLPAYLSMKGIETEAISSGADSVKVNFKATVAPKENLYLVERRVAGSPAVTLLKLVQPEKTESTLYGSIEAKKVVDKWTLEKPVIQNGLTQFGAPKDSFDAFSFVVGSHEADQSLKEQIANLEKASAERKAILDRRIAEEEAIAGSERAAVARAAALKKEDEDKQAAMLRQQDEDKQKLEAKAQMARQEELAKVKIAEDAARDKLSKMLSEGAEFTGVVSHPKSQSRIRMAFKVTGRQGMLVSISARNLDDPSEKREFHGEIKAVEQEDTPKDSPKPYFAILSPGDKNVMAFRERQSGKWAFWLSPGSFGIGIKKDESMFGEGRFGEAFFEMDYEFTFEKVKGVPSAKK